MTLSKGPSGVPEAPSYDIHVACQSSTMAVAPGSHAAGNAGPQQPQKTSSSKTSTMAAPQPAWPGQKLSPSQESSLNITWNGMAGAEPLWQSTKQKHHREGAAMHSEQPARAQ